MKTCSVDTQLTMAAASKQDNMEEQGVKPSSSLLSALQNPNKKKLRKVTTRERSNDEQKIQAPKYKPDPNKPAWFNAANVRKDYISIDADAIPSLSLTAS